MITSRLIKEPLETGKERTVKEITEYLQKQGVEIEYKFPLTAKKAENKSDEYDFSDFDTIYLSRKKTLN